MRFIFIHPPRIVQLLFSNVIWTNVTKEILLTFDDGPNSETTEIILRVLNKYKIKALFFVNGKNGKENFSYLEEISSEGHFFGNHTENHLKNLNNLSIGKIREEILRTDEIISHFQNKTNLFRPPYGRITFKLYRILKSLNLKVMMWTLLTEDYLGDLNIVKRNIDRYLMEKSIIIFHNNPNAKNILHDSLEYLIEKLNERGLRIGDTFSF